MDYKLFKRKREQLKITDVPLNMAVHKLRKEIKAAGQEPGSDQWLYYAPNRQYILARVLEIDPTLIVTEDDVCHVFITQRKSSRGKGDGGPRDQILRLIEERNSCECHWKHNFPGKCSDELSLDRLLPGHRGGTYDDENVVISCLFHNISRGKKTIEEQVTKNKGNKSKCMN